MSSLEAGAGTLPGRPSAAPQAQTSATPGRPSVAALNSVKRDRDSKMLRTVLEVIHVQALDWFLERIQQDQIPQAVLFFWEGFNGVVKSKLFHFYSDVTRELVVRLHKEWQASLSYTDYFSASADGTVLKLDRGGMSYQEQDSIRRNLRQSGRSLSEALADLLKHVREEYVEIDLAETNDCAWNAYLQSETADVPE
ncbi:hypothetical protein [Sorangium sp. So ce1151]|uniref:hypothetical protein n=1 Tax=Sorangium sp. So ce1151 TaxID=3133332 RepID=UPI003F5E60C3